MPQSLVEVQELNFTHRQGNHAPKILDTLTLQLNAGEVVVPTGPSGSGKSTPLTIIGGLRRASEGSVSVFGTQVRADINEREARAAALRKGKVFNGAEVELVVDLALSQALACEKTRATPEGRSELAAALEAVAAADDVVTDEERAVIRELLETP